LRINENAFGLLFDNRYIEEDLDDIEIGIDIEDKNVQRVTR